MLKRKLINIVACFVGSAIIMAGLYAKSLKDRELRTGFVRMLPSHKLIGLSSTDVKSNSWYISGHRGRNLFLGNNINVQNILSVDSGLAINAIIKISGFEETKIHKGSFVLVDSSFFYLMDGITPLILRGNSDDFNLNRKLTTCFFTGGIPLSNSFVLRSVYDVPGNVLVKKTIGSNSLKTSDLLEKQVDGMFCTDGEMIKVPKSSKIIYVYYYRNQFLCADSNLSLIYKGKTIDTISHAQIKVAKVNSTGETTMSAPPLYVNKRACANSKYLFVQSALQANNETEYMIKDVSMIDVYAIADGKYQFSFYLPDFRGFKVRDFKVYGQSLYALYDHYLYKYQLNF